MKIFYPNFKLLFILFLLLGTNFITAQVSMGFEDRTTTQNCSNTACQYIDPISAANAHALVDVGGIPVSSTSSGNILGFTSGFRPTRPGGTGLNDGDFFGYAGALTLANNVAQGAIEGNQAFIMEDTDGEVSIIFDPVNLAGTVSPMFSMNYIIDGTFEVSSGINDRLFIGLDISGCPLATTIDLVNGNGGGVGGITDLNSLPSQTWLALSADLSAYVGCSVELLVEVDFNAASEEVALDNIVFTAGTSLPVELKSFAAIPRGETIALNWSTATEVNNEGFSIERSTDGQNFTKVGWVNGSGTSWREVKYHFDDQNILPNRAYYYRLQQKDFDGTVAFSPIVEATLKNNENEFAGQFYPNPSAEGLSNIDLKVSKSGDYLVKLFSMDGELLTTIKHSLSTGINPVQVDLFDYPEGMYLIQIEGGDQIIYRRLIR